MPPSIAINGRFLTQQMVGVQRFAIEVVKAIDGLIGDGEFPELQGRIEILAPRSARDFSLRHIPLRRCGLGSGYFWEQIECPIYAHGKTLLSLCMVGPVAVRDQVLVVHDATVRALPLTFSARFRAAYNFLIPLLCRRCRCAVTVSEFSRREIGRWYGADVSRMPVCFEGADHLTQVEPDHGVFDRLDLAGRKFFLSVGVGKNKNTDALVAAFEKAQLPDTLLVLTGQRYSWISGREAPQPGDGLRYAGYVTDGELRALYERALGLACASRYEGFGLPPVEAMTAGCPVIISDQPAMLEICGDAALHCAADDTTAMARLMRRVHADPALRTSLVAAGHARVARFTWRATARMLLEICLREADSRSYASAVLPALPRAG
jgi:glycosyltransferase involved in cell wall biosynthesis